MSSRRQRAQQQAPAPTIFEFKGCVWFNGSEAGDIGVLKRSRRVMVRFVLSGLIRLAVADFCESFAEWHTDADDVTTHELVRRLERWLAGITHNQL